MRRGLPPVGERTLRLAYERVLARTPDAEAQADETGSVTFAAMSARWPATWRRVRSVSSGCARRTRGW